MSNSRQYLFLLTHDTAWIPTYSLGREWREGISVGEPNPELNLSLLLGTFGSAFCATLSHFYKEVRPALSGLPMIDDLDNLVNEVCTHDMS